MEVLEKLRSFDADIRYMGLSDMEKAIVSGGTGPAWLDGAVEHLGDTALEVQNLAIRVTSELAALEPARVVSLVLGSSAPAVVRAVALKGALQQTRAPSAGIGEAIVAALETDAMFETVEGAEVVIELLGSDQTRARLQARTRALFDYARQIAKHPGLLRMRSFEILALILPMFSDAEWAAVALPYVRESTAREPAALALVGKLAGSVPASWLVPELEERLYTPAESPEDVDMCEAAIDALAALYSVNGSDLARADSLAARMIGYREYDGGSAGSAGGDSDLEMEWDGASDDSEWFDESSRVRKAAAKLARRSASPALVAALYTAALAEKDESSRAAMYGALAEMPAAEAKAVEVEPEAFAQRVTKDMAQGNWTAASAGITALAAWGQSPLVARLIREAAMKRPALLHQYITLLKAPARGIAGSVDASDDTSWILSRAMEPDIAAIPETAIHALALAAELRLSQFALGASRLARSTNFAEALRIAALHTVGKLAGPAEWPEVIPVVLHCLKAEPGLRPAALDALAQAANYTEISIEDARNIVYALNEILSVAPGPAVATKCCNVLGSLPDTVAPQIASTALALDDTELKSRKEAILMTDCRAAQPGVLKWAITSGSDKLLMFLAATGESSVIRAAIETSDVPEVHAAAAGPHWAALDGRYHFSTTDFSQLNHLQLRVLLALAKQGIDWNWYSMPAMLGSELEENAALKGQVIGRASVNKSTDTEREFVEAIPLLRGDVVETSLPAFAAATSNKSAVFELALNNARAQIPAGLAAAISTQELLAEFLAKFESAHAALAVNTIKLLRGDVLRSSVPVLIRYLRDVELDSDTRAEACMTVVWVLQMEEVVVPIYEHFEAAMEAFAAALVPLTDQVQTLNIGPFKHRVDRNLPLRQAAIDGIYTCVNLARLDRYDHLVDAVVDHGLYDELEVKIVACRAVGLLAELDFAAVLRRQVTIDERFDEDLARKLKDSATKDDIEKQTALVMAIEKTRGLLKAQQQAHVRSTRAEP